MIVMRSFVIFLCFYASFFAHGDEILGLNSCLFEGESYFEHWKSNYLLGFLAIYIVASMLLSFSMPPTFFSIFFCMFLVALVFWKTNSKVRGGIGLLPFRLHLKICNFLGRDVAIGSVHFVVPLHSRKCISSYFSPGWLLANNNLLANGPCYFRLPFQFIIFKIQCWGWMAP